MFPPISFMRNWRWQFSLRALLLIMAVVCVALTVYRWPWVEITQQSPDPIPGNDPFGDVSSPRTQYLTTYRRDWRGRPVKHGLSQYRYNDVLVDESHYYDGELHGTQQSFDEEGKLTFQQSFRAGRR